MKHTPGPWKIIRASEYTDDPEDTKIMSIKAANGKSVYYTEYGYFEPEEADALLIAAAPELLEALKAVLLQAEEMLCDEFKTDDLTEWPWIVSARAAIARAEGGE